MKVYELLKKNQYGQYLKDVLDGLYKCVHLLMYRHGISLEGVKGNEL